MNTATPFPWPDSPAGENSRTTFRAAFEHAPIAVARCKPQGVIVEMNPAFERTLDRGVASRRRLRLGELVLDQFLLENEPAESDQVLEHLGTAFPVYLNFAVSGMERLLREVRSALHRRKREETQARRSVEQQIRSEMCESLTVMLLSCELAMAVPGVPTPADEKIRMIDNLARDMRLRLTVN
jgi:PAS domain-containing protein